MESEDILHAVSVKLYEFEDIEMILLKGHLILEQTVNNLIYVHVKDHKKIDKMKLQFAKKIDLLAAILGSGTIFSKEYKHLKEINRIRNKLAHDLFFDKFHDDLKTWSCSVLGYTPKTINRKTTYKNSVIKAFSFIAGLLTGMKIGTEEVMEMQSDSR